jgi:hypothetical protein
MLGCGTTLKEAQQSPPTFTISSDLPAKTFANKIVYESTKESINSPMFPDWNPAQLIEMENGVQKVLLTFTSRGNILLIPYPPLPVADITITPKESGGSFLEYRGVRWVSQEKFLAMIQQCASPQNSPGK